LIIAFGTTAISAFEKEDSETKRGIMDVQRTFDDCVYKSHNKTS